MVKKILFILVLVSEIFRPLAAQVSKKDSIFSLSDDSSKVKMILEQAAKNGYNNRLGKEYAMEAERISQKINFDKGLTKAVNFLGNHAFLHGDYDNSLKYYTKAMNLAGKLNFKKEAADMMMGIGLTYYAKADLQQSLDWHLKSLKIRESINDSLGIAASFIHLGNIYQYRKNYDKAEEVNLKALQIKRNIKDREGEIYCLGNLGSIYGTKKDYVPALKNFESALQISREINNTRLIASNLGNIGLVYENLGDYKKALKFMNESMSIDEKSDDKEGFATSLINIGGLYSRVGDNENAIRAYEKSLKIASEIGALDLIRIIYDALAKIYHIKNDNTRAYNYMISYSKIKDSILNIENQESLNRMQELYHSEKKDKEILQKDHEIERQELQNNRQKLMIVFAALVLILVGAFSIVLFNRFKLTQKQKLTIEEKQTEIMDSINYAQRIQRALLASDDLLKDNLKEHFVYFKPKAVVSGDFYWAAVENNKFYLAVCDSTGHGVPGAFMSLLNIAYLNEAIKEKKIDAPGEILNHVRKRLIENISSEGAQDGMDGILICIDTKANDLNGNIKVSYSAANNAPIVIQNNKAIELKKDKMPVGKGDNTSSFATHELILSKNDSFYLYTDGYADQFGGIKGKKFMYKELNDLLLSISSLSLKEQRDRLDMAFGTWKGSLEQIDDVCIIGIRL